MRYELKPKSILHTHILCIAVLFFAHSLGLIAKLYFGYEWVYGLVPLFDFDTEKNVPTLFSSVMLLLSSLLLFLIASHCKQRNESFMPWLILSGIFLFLCVDEINGIHERLIDHTRHALEIRGAQHFAWVIPYGLAVVVFVAAYARFLCMLPTNTRTRLIISGLVFISGAIGFESLSGNFAELNGKDNFIYAFYYTCEELLEMLGIALFIYALLSHITDHFGHFRITISQEAD